MSFKNLKCCKELHSYSSLLVLFFYLKTEIIETRLNRYSKLMHQDGGVITTIDVTVAKVLIVLIMTILHMNRFNNSNIIKIKLQQVKN